jgi:peptidoglycan/xylan/chitin deacetylase (PgdA/CDA1 family)
MRDGEADRAARGRTRGERSAAARRARVRRRRAAAAALLVGLLALVALVVALAGGGGSHARSGATVSGGAPAGTPVAGASSRAASPTSADAESPAIRRLIALGKPIYCAAPRGNEVALTFDDGPGPYTELVLRKLHVHRARTTFFVVGRNIGLVQGATRQEAAIGAVGDHTFTHPLLTGLAPGEAESEIVRTQTALERSTGKPVFLFRPPYGGRDATIDAIARAHGLLQILWTVDSADSLGANYAQIERNVIGGLRPGAIILMHENHGQTVRALLNIFVALERKRLRAVSVPQLLTDDTPSAAQVNAGGLGCGGRSATALTGG